MAVRRYGWVTGLTSGRPNNNPSSYYDCDLSSELPTSGVVAGDMAFARDTDRIYSYNNGSWRSISETINVQNEGTALPAQPTLNFTGDGVHAANDPGNNRTNVTISIVAAGMPGFTWGLLGTGVVTVANGATEVLYTDPGTALLYLPIVSFVNVNASKAIFHGNPLAAPPANTAAFSIVFSAASENELWIRSNIGASTDVRWALWSATAAI